MFIYIKKWHVIVLSHKENWIHFKWFKLKDSKTSLLCTGKEISRGLWGNQKLEIYCKVKKEKNLKKKIGNRKIQTIPGLSGHREELWLLEVSEGQHFGKRAVVYVGSSKCLRCSAEIGKEKNEQTKIHLQAKEKKNLNSLFSVTPITCRYIPLSEFPGSQRVRKFLSCSPWDAAF